ncbi:hypothetical protein ACWDNT_13390, partial [Streptomyces sp. NPDC000963]
MTVTGAAAVALTVAAGAYLASTAGGPAVGGPAAAVSPAPVPVTAPVPVRVEAEPEQARAQLSERLPVVVPGGGTAAARKSERFVREVIALTNAERTRAGCRPLRTDKNLRTAARLLPVRPGEPLDLNQTRGTTIIRMDLTNSTQ